MFKTNRMALEIIPVKIQKEIESDDDLVDLILESSEINEDDILVFSQKIISKNEGRILSLSSVKPSLLADGIASSYGKDPRLVELILSESKRIVRMENGIIIVETNHGFVCANAGIDESNVQDGYATLLPDDPDKSANLLKDRIKQKTGKHTAVIISDTFGRPFRLGQTDVAIGIAGLEPILDYNGKPDTFGKIMQVTAIAVADEICSASELVMGKVEKCPIAIVRNYDFSYSDVKIQKMLRSDHDDLVDLILKSSEINEDDILVFSQKIISKNEGRILSLSSVKPSLLADGIASSYGKDPRLVELILSESKRIVRMENGIIIVETKHGFVCANAGIDESNVEDGYATLLPDDPDKSANLLKDRIKKKTGKNTAVIISDTFGRPFRLGQTDIAIGIAGLEPILDYSGKPDTFGKIMQVTAIAVADEICSASELVMGKIQKCPVAIVRNYNFSFSDAKIQKLLRSEHDDLFR